MLDQDYGCFPLACGVAKAEPVKQTLKLTTIGGLPTVTWASTSRPFVTASPTCNYRRPMTNLLERGHSN